MYLKKSRKRSVKIKSRKKNRHKSQKRSRRKNKKSYSPSTILGIGIPLYLLIITGLFSYIYISNKKPSNFQDFDINNFDNDILKYVKYFKHVDLNTELKYDYENNYNKQKKTDRKAIFTLDGCPDEKDPNNYKQEKYCIDEKIKNLKNFEKDKNKILFMIDESNTNFITEKLLKKFNIRFKEFGLTPRVIITNYDKYNEKYPEIRHVSINNDEVKTEISGFFELFDQNNPEKYPVLIYYFKITFILKNSELKVDKIEVEKKLI